MTTYSREYIDLFISACTYTQCPITEPTVRKYFEMQNDKQQESMRRELGLIPSELTALQDAHFLFNEGISYGHSIRKRK